MAPANLNAVSHADDESEIEVLKTDSAREKLFDMILDQLAASSLFSNSALAPSIFIVYAHDNEKEGSAYDGCVKKIILWLRKIHARILSDQSPLPLLLPRIEGTDAICNIVANQMCLLSGTPGSNKTPIRTSVDKVIVCGSEVLERYCNKPSSERYIEDIVRICTDGAEQQGRALESSVGQRVEEEIECGNSDFHHVLTELAFLEVRKFGAPEAHGMVPVALNQLDANAAPMQYLPTFRSTDVKLKLKSLAASSLYILFFKILIQLFPKDADFIEPFRECYMSVSEALQLDSQAHVSREVFDDIVMPQITEAYRKYWRLFCVVVRDGKLQAYTGQLGHQISKVLEQTGISTQHQILHWLSGVSAPKLHVAFRNPKTSRIHGTCNWIIQTEEFRLWCTGEASALVSLYGDMGMGKTYCASRVIDWVKEGLSTNDNDEAFAYFYCNKQDRERSEGDKILRNIIQQLSTGPWNELESSKTIHKTVYQLWKKDKGMELSYSFAELEGCLLALIGTYPKTTIVLDALDECEETQREDLLDVLASLAERRSGSNPVKIFITTRPEQVILERLAPYPAIRMQKRHNSEDIGTFAATKFKSNRTWSRFPEDFRRKIVEQLLEKSGDMFLFAALQLEDLLKCRTTDAIGACLARAPKSLNEKYEDICQQAAPTPEDRKVLDRMLGWVSCSPKPLTTNELLFAINQDSKSDSINFQREVSYENLLLDWSHNLLSLDVVYDDKPPVWRLTHQAVAEFLETSTSCNSVLAHREAARVCLMILIDSFGGNSAETRRGSLDASEGGNGSTCSCERHIKLSSAEGRYSQVKDCHLRDVMTGYAIYAWPTHVRGQDGEIRGIDGLSQTLQRFLGQPDKGGPIYERWLKRFHGEYLRMWPVWSIFKIRRIPALNDSTHMPPMTLACHLGIYNTLLEWWNSPSLNQDMCFSWKFWWPVKDRYPFRKGTIILLSLIALSCAHNETKIFNHLLDRGAKVDNGTENENIPTIVAAVLGDAVEAMEELIKRGVTINSPFTHCHGHILSFAIKFNSLKVMRLLLQQPGLCHREEVEEIIYPLSSEDIKSADTITLLVGIGGVDVNSRNEWSGNLLALAVRQKWENAVRWLLDKGAELENHFEPVTPKIPGFSTVLEAAVVHSTPTICDLLLERGARLTSRIVAQAFRRYSESDEVLELLLQHEPDLNETWSEDGEETSVLIEAICGGHSDHVQSLLQHSANPNLRVRGTHADALNAAFDQILMGSWLEYRNEPKLMTYPTAAVLEALRVAGASLKNVGVNRLKVALAAAALGGLEDLVEAFLHFGASPNLCCCHDEHLGEASHCSALGWAAASNHPRAPGMVRLLLDRGADVNVYCDIHCRDSAFLSPVALDTPLMKVMLSLTQKPMEGQDECLDTWLQSVSILVENGAVWDLDFAQWRRCLGEKRNWFAQCDEGLLDSLQGMLKENRSKFFLKYPPSAFEDRWRIKDATDLGLSYRSVVIEMRSVLRGWT